MQERIFNPARELIEKFWIGLSKVIAGVLVLIVGWIIAKIIKLLVIRFFQIIKVDKLSEDSGLKNFLDKGNITKNVSELLGISIYWIIMLVVVFLAINVVGISIPSTVIDSLLSFIPKFILGLLIFIFSLFIGNLFGGIVKTSASNTGIEKADLLGKLTQGAIIIFGTVVALQQIGIASNFIGNVFIIILASFCFGIALALGLGAKDIVKEYIEKFFSKK